VGKVTQIFCRHCRRASATHILCLLRLSSRRELSALRAARSADSSVERTVPFGMTNAGYAQPRLGGRGEGAGPYQQGKFLVGIPKTSRLKINQQRATSPPTPPPKGRGACPLKNQTIPGWGANVSQLEINQQRAMCPPPLRGRGWGWGCVLPNIRNSRPDSQKSLPSVRNLKSC